MTFFFKQLYETLITLQNTIIRRKNEDKIYFAENSIILCYRNSFVRRILMTIIRLIFHVWYKTLWFLQRKVNEKCEEAEGLIFRPNI